MTTDGTQTLYLKGYDTDNNPTGYITGTWTILGGIGSCTPEYGSFTVFNPTTTGTGTISAQYEGMRDNTGVITVNAGSLFLVRVSAAPATILKNGTFTLTIIPEDRDGNIIQSTGTARISNLTTSISPTAVTIRGNTTLVATITASPSGGWDEIKATVTIGSKRIPGTCSILVLVPRGQFAVALSQEATYRASGSFTEDFWLKIEDASETGVSVQLADMVGRYLEITMGTEAGRLTGTLPTTILVEIPFDSTNLRKLDRSTLKLWIYRDGGWQEVEESGVYADKDYVWARITHLSLFALSGKVFAATDLKGAFAYPNPCYTDKNTSIWFGNLTENSTIQIFTIAGELVREIRADRSPMSWDICNEAGEKVASGVYIYLITNDKEQKAVGKIGIVK